MGRANGQKTMGTGATPALPRGLFGESSPLRRGRSVLRGGLLSLDEVSQLVLECESSRLRRGRPGFRGGLPLREELSRLGRESPLLRRGRPDLRGELRESPSFRRGRSVWRGGPCLCDELPRFGLERGSSSRRLGRSGLRDDLLLRSVLAWESELELELELESYGSRRWGWADP